MQIQEVNWPAFSSFSGSLTHRRICVLGFLQVLSIAKIYCAYLVLVCVFHSWKSALPVGGQERLRTTNISNRFIDYQEEDQTLRSWVVVWKAIDGFKFRVWRDSVHLIKVHIMQMGLFVEFFLESLYVTAKVELLQLVCICVYTSSTLASVGTLSRICSIVFCLVSPV